MTVVPLAAANNLVDPTRPPDYAAAQQRRVVEIPQQVRDFRLNAVKFSGASRWAIINGNRVAPGEQIGPATVVDIQPASVVLDYEGERLTLNLLEHTVKNPAAKGQK